MPHNQQAVEQTKRDCRYDEQIHRGDAVGMIAKERPPALGWRVSSPGHVLGPAGLSDIDADLEEFSIRGYWRWKSRPQGGRPQIDTELRALIRRMSVENPLWGAPRIHGEPLKLGVEVAQSSVAKYMVKRRGPPSQGWRTFLRNHAPDIAAMHLFVVPTVGFDLLYAFVIVRLGRRGLVCINVTANPTAEWVARQITEAFPWDEAPHYLIRDRDRIYSSV